MSSVSSYDETSEEEDLSESFVVLNQDSVSESSIEIEDVLEAIQSVRRTILETEVSSQARKDLVHKLIRLRIKKEDLETRKSLQVFGVYHVVDRFSELDIFSYLVNWNALVTTLFLVI